MEKHFSVVVLGFAVFAAVIAKNTDALEVKVYYETKSQGCGNFITEQLHPTYMAINNLIPNATFKRYYTYMTVKLVPYGNAFKLTQLENGTWQIECKERGEKACIYNKFHACAIKTGSSPWTSLNYINILVTYAERSSPTTMAKLTCFDDTPMAPCVNTVDGDELLIGHGRETLALNVSLASLPIVTFDGVYKEEEQQRARENLLSVVCEKTGDRPDVCASPRAKRVMTHQNFGTDIYYPKKILCEY